jgi:hypothetical protein
MPLLALFWSAGKGFFMAGLQQNLSIFIGVAMIVVVVIQTNFFCRNTIFQNLFLN